MKALVDGKQVPLKQINLDDLGWDHRRSHGSVTLILQLTTEDLLAIGKAVYAEAKAAITEDPQYFEDDFAHLPVPASETVFIENPNLLGEYLTERDFWHHITIEKVVDHIEYLSGTKSESRYLIAEFRKVTVENEKVILELGAGQVDYRQTSRWKAI